MKERKTGFCLYINTRHGNSALPPRRNQGPKVMSLKPQKLCLLVENSLLKMFVHGTSTVLF